MITIMAERDSAREKNLSPISEELITPEWAELVQDQPGNPLRVWHKPRNYASTPQVTDVSGG